MSWRLSQKDTGLLVLDAQEKLVPVIQSPSDWLKRLEILIQGARLLELPIVLTEQVPAKLGKTVASVQKAVGSGIKAVAKTRFSAAEEGKGLGRKRILVAGCETHVCVRQTVYDLRLKELTPVVVADAVGSREVSDRETALGEMRADGVVVSTVEAVLFEILESSEHAKFKEVQSLLK
ncbi:MAG: isochorismatase family protein [Verrucomicrobia bacterium]|jgi:nicotinamidase-related amidase|nr:isochorismatase family protein [Verrucomicrobiota bacterium]